MEQNNFPYGAGHHQTCWSCGDLGWQFYGSGLVITKACKCIQEKEAKKNLDIDAAYAGI